MLEISFKYYLKIMKGLNLMSQKIVIKMKGGLGNQLFIYAYAKSLQEKYPNAEFFYDFTAYKKTALFFRKCRGLSARYFEMYPYLDKNNIIPVCNSGINKLIYSIIYFTNKKNIIKRKMHLAESFKNPFINKLHWAIIDDTNYEKPFLIKSNNNFYLDGGFQSVHILNQMKRPIEYYFKFYGDVGAKFKEYYSYIKNNEYIGISIRLGDYLSKGWPICSKAFFKKGIELIRIKNSNAKLLVFSDDIEAAESEYDFKDAVYVKGCSVIESFELLRRCQYHVIANSTFSWWGAYASYNKGMVVAPEYWLINQKTTEKKYFERMVIVDNNGNVCEM